MGTPSRISSSDKQVRFVAVVEVGGVVGDLVGEVDELRFQRWAIVEKIFGKLRMIFWGVVVRVLDDALTNFEGQVESAERSVALLEIFHDAESVEVVIEEESVLTHGGVEGLFSGMTEGRVSDVVD